MTNDDKIQLTDIFLMTKGDAYDQLKALALSDINEDFEGVLTLMISAGMTIGRMQGLSIAIETQETFHQTMRAMRDYLEAIAKMVAQTEDKAQQKEIRDVIDPVEAMLAAAFQATPDGEVN